MSLDVRTVSRLWFEHGACIAEATWREASTIVGSAQLILDVSDGLPSCHISRTGSGITINQEVRLASTACHFGGQRLWFTCPGIGCGRRCMILYRPQEETLFLCRTCHRLLHRSTREPSSLRIGHRMSKIERLLGADAGDRFPPSRPSAMHARTFRRLVDQYFDLACRWALAITRETEFTARRRGRRSPGATAEEL